MPRKQMLTTDEASEYLGVSVSTLEAWRSRGRPVGPVPVFLKISHKCVRYLEEDLDAFLAKCRHETTYQKAR